MVLSLFWWTFAKQIPIWIISFKRPISYCLKYVKPLCRGGGGKVRKMSQKLRALNTSQAPESQHLHRCLTTTCNPPPWNPMPFSSPQRNPHTGAHEYMYRHKHIYINTIKRKSFQANLKTFYSHRQAFCHWDVSPTCDNFFLTKAETSNFLEDVVLHWRGGKAHHKCQQYTEYCSELRNWTKQYH